MGTDAGTVGPTQLLRLYRLVFMAVIIVASIQALYAEHAHHPVVLLASAEILGAAFMGWRRTQWFGACLLLAVFAAAQVMSAMAGEWPARFVLYAASALLIVTMDSALRVADRKS